MQNSDPCVLKQDCSFYNINTQEQISQLSNSYKIKKDKKSEKKTPSPSLVNVSIVLGPVNMTTQQRQYNLQKKRRNLHHLKKRRSPHHLKLAIASLMILKPLTRNGLKDSHLKALILSKVMEKLADQPIVPASQGSSSDNATSCCSEFRPTFPATDRMGQADQH